MKNLIIGSLIMAVMLSVGSFSAATEAQSPSSALKPTFLAPTPGLFVNGWPLFTLSYPKDWVELPLLPGQVFRVAQPSQSLNPSPILVINVFANPRDISNSAKAYAELLGRFSKYINVLYDKPSHLEDGTPAQEAEIECVITTGPRLNIFLLATRKDATWIWVHLTDDKGKVGEDLKSIVYSLKVRQGEEKPVKVPPDVRKFLDKYCSDVASHDVGKIMTNYSDQLLHSGIRKATIEQWFRSDPDSPIQLGITSLEVTVTIFEVQGEKAYLAGFFGGKLRSGAKGPTTPIADNQIVKENGQWKWYGNQKQ